MAVLITDDQVKQQEQLKNVDKSILLANKLDWGLADCKAV